MSVKVVTAMLEDDVIVKNVKSNGSDEGHACKPLFPPGELERFPFE